MDILLIKKFIEFIIINDRIIFIKNKSKCVSFGKFIFKFKFKMIIDMINSGINIKIVVDKKLLKLDVNNW